jgi:hypothetical protein
MFLYLHVNLLRNLYKNLSMYNNMKLVYFSDLHLEFIDPNKIEQFIKNSIWYE